MSRSRSVMVDTGFWIAFYEPRDQYHMRAKSLDLDLDAVPLLVPWPSLYETFSTRFVRDQRRVSLFMTVLRRSNITRFEDQKYREDALEIGVTAKPKRYRPLSLVDRVIRLALEDPDVNVGGLLTFNPNDFRDVCRRRGIELIPAT